MKMDYVQIVFNYKGDENRSVWIPASEFDVFKVEHLRNDVRLMGNNFHTVKSAQNVFIKFRKKNSFMSVSTARILERPDIKKLVFVRGIRKLSVYVPWTDSAIGTPPYNIHQKTEYKDGVVTIDINRKINIVRSGLSCSENEKGITLEDLIPSPGEKREKAGSSAPISNKNIIFSGFDSGDKTIKELASEYGVSPSSLRYHVMKLPEDCYGRDGDTLTVNGKGQEFLRESDWGKSKLSEMELYGRLEKKFDEEMEKEFGKGIRK